MLAVVSVGSGVKLRRRRLERDRPQRLIVQPVVKKRLSSNLLAQTRQNNAGFDLEQDGLIHPGALPRWVQARHVQDRRHWHAAAAVRCGRPGPCAGQCLLQFLRNGLQSPLRFPGKNTVSRTVVRDSSRGNPA